MGKKKKIKTYKSEKSRWTGNMRISATLLDQVKEYAESCGGTKRTVFEESLRDFFSDGLPKSPLYRKRIEDAAKKAGYDDPEEFLYVAARYYLKHLKAN